MRRRSTGLVLIAAGILVAVLTWVASTWSYAVLASPSMEPFASSGDLLIHRLVPAHVIEVDDVVTVPVADRGLVTHRVVRLLRTDGRIVARLKGDRSRLPDPVPVDLVGDVARVEVVVPGLGGVLRVGAPLLWGGTVLLALGGGALYVARRREEEEPLVPVPAPVGTGEPSVPEPVAPEPLAPEPAAPEPATREPIASPPTAEPAAAALDPRVDALLASCEQFAEDGMDATVLADLVRVRIAMLVGAPPAERAGIVLDLDDGGRFYVIALADADVDALGLVPAASQRRRAATEALDVWWSVIRDRVPEDVLEAVAPWT